MAESSDYYDENFDQNPNEGSDEKEASGYESFLAPKAAFPESAREVGAVHKVKTMRSLDSELELKCVEGEKDEPESEDNAAEETEEDPMYS